MICTHVRKGRIIFSCSLSRFDLTLSEPKMKRHHRHLRLPRCPDRGRPMNLGCRLTQSSPWDNVIGKASSRARRSYIEVNYCPVPHPKKSSKRNWERLNKNNNNRTRSSVGPNALRPENRQIIHTGSFTNSAREQGSFFSFFQFSFRTIKAA